MPWLEREHPQTPCQPEGAHHPHRQVCSDSDCDCYLDFDGKPYSVLLCCIDGQDWPCETKRQHHTERAS